VIMETATTGHGNVMVIMTAAISRTKMVVVSCVELTELFVVD